MIPKTITLHLFSKISRKKVHRGFYHYLTSDYDKDKTVNCLRNIANLIESNMVDVKPNKKVTFVEEIGSLMDEVKLAHKTGIYRCIKCHEPFEKVSEYNYVPKCKCFKKKVSLLIG